MTTAATLGELERLDRERQFRTFAIACVELGEYRRARTYLDLAEREAMRKRRGAGTS